jgi:hypothetical protein
MIRRLPLGAVRPEGWIAALMKEEWERGFADGGSRDRWMRHALLVGGGKGRLEARAWVNRLLTSPEGSGSLSPPVARAVLAYAQVTGDTRVFDLLPRAPEPAASHSPDIPNPDFDSCLALLESSASREWADRMEALVLGNRDLSPALAEAAVLADPSGLRIALYGPVRVKTPVAGVSVEIECETDFPAARTVALRFYPQESVEFSLFLRVPSWAEGLLITGDGAHGGEMADEEGWVEIRRRWNRGDSLDLTFEGDPA